MSDWSRVPGTLAERAAGRSRCVKNREPEKKRKGKEKETKKPSEH
jgi:hypothetical protein